jgi:hypothetical protein
MPNQKQTQKLINKIRHSIFLKEELKKRLLDNFERLGPGDFERLAAFFGEAEKKQESLLGKIVKHDGTFLPRLKYFIQGEIGKYHGGREKAQRKKEKAEDILKEIE